MAFPSLVPTSREFAPGDWPIKRFNSQSGSEISILYGNQRSNAELSLRYENITDFNAEKFLVHYASQYGTYRTFDLPDSARTGSTVSIEPPPQTKWRYDAQPTITSVRPGVSTVDVKLKAVL